MEVSGITHVFLTASNFERPTSSTASYSRFSV